MGIKYVDYLNATLPGRQADLAARKEEIQAQIAKNLSAPTVSGGSSYNGSGGGFQAYSGPITAAKGGGKVLPIDARQSQGWGKSRIKYAAGRHTGVDFGAPVGTAVKSAANGVVVGVGRQGAYGNVVKVRHADGTTALYGHLSGSNVKPGQRVRAGQRIAQSGNSGRSTGAHLHFEIRSRDTYGGDINPNNWYSR